MNHCRLFVLGTVLAFAVIADAQQPATTGAAAHSASNVDAPGLPPVEAQMNFLTEKLSLTTAQRKKIRPILKHLHDATEKLAGDKNLSHEEQLARIRPQRYQADARIRAVLSDDQKKKLDAYERGPHPEMHGNLTGTPAAHQ